jgi:hypothetical protein
MMDCFISHSSANRTVAVRLEAGLEAAGLSVWLDDSEGRLGVLLAHELQAAIGDARVLVLLWSKHALTRWIASEWLTAFHLERFIIPCTLDETPLPQCLQNSVYLPIRQVTAGVVDRLAEEIRRAPDGRNPMPAVPRAQAPAMTATIVELHRRQSAVLDGMPGKLASARRLQQRLDHVTEEALSHWPLDAEIVNLAGYHLKNAYLLSHWDEVQAGRGPRDDSVLARSEDRFLESLAIDPQDPSALNGLGNILFFRRDLEAAEFFVLAALREAGRRGYAYPEAEHDLEMIRQSMRP